MNLYGIFAWFGYVLPLKERLHLISEAGFTSVMLWWGNEFYELDGEKMEHPDLARKHNLLVENVHAPYQFTNDLWDEGLNGNNFEKLIAGCIEDCAACEVPTLVMHIANGPMQPGSVNAGIQRLTRLLELAERNHITLALENVDNIEYLDLVFSRLHSDCLGFCYDSGHEFAVSGKFLLLNKYGSMLKALHLHDNNGKEDQHLLPGEGHLDWIKVTSQIRDTGYKGSLSLESSAPWYEDLDESKRESPEHYLRRAYQAAKKLSYNITNNYYEQY